MRHFPLYIILTGLFSFQDFSLFSQTTQTIFYTTKDGLPSNAVYRTIIDHHGFLWIATENGLAKFDGKNFKIYTTSQGLPDNEITDIYMDSSRTIWVTPFRKTPSYYNPLEDRFENEDTDPQLKKIELGNTSRGSVLAYGGIAFCNNLRDFFICKNGKVTAFKGLISKKAGGPFRIIENQPGTYILVCSDSIRMFKDGRIVGAVYFGQDILNNEYFNHSLYICSENLIFRYSVNPEGELKLRKTGTFPFKVRIFCRTGKNLAVTSFNGTTYLVDTFSLELKDALLYDLPVRNVLEDNTGSTWISTIDKGLIKIQQKRISSFAINDKKLNDLVQQNFNSLLVSNRKIYVGNNYGEVLEYDGVYDIKRIALSTQKNMDGTVRKILDTRNGIFVSCQNGSFLFDKKDHSIKSRLEGPGNYSTKTAAVMNDTILLLGSHSRASIYDLVKGRMTDSIVKRVTALLIDKRKLIYIGSNDGLYRWDEDTLFYFGRQHKAFTYRVNTLCCTPDGLVWVGLGSDSLLVLRNDSLIQSIPLGNLINGNVCKSLFSNRSGEIWLGTNKGLNKIEYSYNKGEFYYTSTFFGLSDGLIGEQVNDIAIYHDTVYVATSGGISYLPVILHLPVTDIATFISRVSVNGKDTLVQEGYSLPYDKNDISIEFSGVDLTGYSPFFEHSINNGEWQRTDKNSIELLRLSPGIYNIRIRAIKRDGKPSSVMASLDIEIMTPFWRNGIFWTIVGMVLFVASIFFLQLRNRQKQRMAVEKVVTEKKLAELEMQALKAQINPHFVFNCLNSIKGFIFDRDYKQADKYLDKFSELLRSTLDNSSSSVISLQEELNYLDNYLQLEKLRFDDRFEYRILPDPEIDSTAWFVPAMLLQPYVENAIRHGIRHLENKQGLISISLKKDQSGIICQIEDNGVGRDKAYELRNEMHTEYQSRGMQLSRRRAELYGIEQQIIDKKDEKGNPTGTVILLKIPQEGKT